MFRLLSFTVSLTLCVPMDSSLLFYIIHFGWSSVYMEGSQVIISKKILYFSEDQSILS